MTIRHFFNLSDSLLLITISLLAISSANAAPGTLANEPLQTSSSAPPNILFHLDTSGSMDHIVAETDSSYSFECTDAIAKIQSGDTWSWRIDGTGSSSKPYIVQGGKDYDLGNNLATRCFDPAATFYTTLRKDIAPVYLGGDVPYTGAYLNWYFNTATDGTGNWDDNEYKPGVRPRMEVAQTSLKALLDTLQNNVNVGLSTFSGGDGASIDQAIADLDATHLGNMITSIDAASPSGYTPLAESARDIGRYFSNSRGTTPGQCGGGSSTLTIHPGPDEQSVDCALTLGSRITLAGPTQYFCQKNFSVMLTDGQPTADLSISSNLQDYDKDCTSDAQSAGGYTCDSANDEKSDVTYLSTTGHSDFWDDVTTALYDIDLRPDLNDSDGNPVKNNVITYTIGFADEQVRDHPLIRQAAEQAGGEFIFAEDSSELRQAFDRATKSIIAQSSTSSAVTFNSSTLSSQSAVYQALFNTVRWSGELRSIPLDGFTGAVLTDCVTGTDNCWSAAEQLDAQTPNSRTILTYHPTETQGRAFRSPADYTAPTTSEIPQPLVDDLCKGPNIPNTCDATTAADAAKKSANQSYINDLVNYLRGDRSNEGVGRSFRTRTNVLGDIVNASPVYVSSVPASNWPNRAPFPEAPDPADPGYDPTAPDNSYSNWVKSSIKDRVAVVYAASNDGLLHGFRTTESSDGAGDAGNEVLAYVPTGTFSDANTAGLHYLADPAYQHLFYNDLTPTISDVYMNHRDTSSGAVTSSPEWRTMLLGGQRGGGRVLYLLDITDPSEFSEANAKQLVEWEFSHPDLGYTFSKPTIAMMNDGRFAAIFGNGYNSNDGGGDCRAKLFVVYLEGGQDGSWTLGSDYQIFDTAVGDATDCNGLSTPAVVDLNRDGAADRVYAGDVHGNLWALDLCNFDTTNEVCQSTGWGQISKIMTAQDSSGNRQPITVKPVVSRDPVTTGSDNLLITFGTGQYMTDSDKTDTSVQTMYGVREYSALTNGGNYNQNPRTNPGRFIEQTITEISDCSTQVTNCNGSVRTISNNSLSSNDRGWMIDLPTTGERVVVNPLIRNNILFFNTLIPDSTVCSAGGSGWLMSVGLQNGGTPDRVIFDINNDGVIDEGDKINGDPPVGQKVKTIPAESTFLGDKQYTPDSEGNINVRDVNIGKVRREGRMSWRELFFD